MAEVKTLGTFIDPVKGREFPIMSIPIEKLEPSPYQREVSKSLKDNLEMSISKLGFLSIPLAVQNEDKYYLIDGMHRVEALKNLVGEGIEVPCIVLPPEKEFLYCLDFNVEKAPNIKEKSKQIYKMYMDEVENNPNVLEKDLASLFEIGYYVTCGVALEEEDPKFSPSCFENILKKVDTMFLELPIYQAYKERQKRARILVKTYEKVNKRFYELGLRNYFLKSAIVAKAFQKIYGQRVRAIDDDFYTCFEKLNREIPNVVISESES